MIYRLALFSLLLLFASNVFAAQCLDVFPSGWRPLTPISDQLINFPLNGSSATLAAGTTLNRGENLYANSSLGNLDELYVAPVTGSETTARLFFTDAVSWQNVKINENGNPEDLIIVIDGSLQISGDSTVVNAIIYVKGAMTFSGAGIINGSAAAVGSAVNFGISINYNSSYIINADFNGMCDNVSVDHFEIVHDAVGSTCDTESVVIKACANNDCSILITDEVTLDFQGNSTTILTQTFTGSSTLIFEHFTEETLTLSVANPSIAPNNNLVCDDGSGNSCDIVFSSETCNPFAAWWQFENNFLDSSSSDTHNLIPTNSPLFGSNNPDPANTIGNESTCRYVSFDGSNYASIDDSGDFNFQDLSVSTWVYPTSYSTGGGLRSLISKDEHFEFHLNSSGKLYWWWRTPGGTSHTLTSSATIPLNTWTHVAVVYDSLGEQYMYINGGLANSASYDDGLANSPCDFYIGTDVGTGSSTACGGVIQSRNFKGHMDEVHIYDRVLTASEIQDDLNVVHSCSLFDIDHFQINHDGQGLTCEAENITIKACADPTCSTLSTTSTTDVKLSINGTLDKTVTVSDGSTVTNFSYTDTITPATLSLDQTYECKNGGSSSCEIAFADAGFKFLYGAAESSIIGSQVSGNNFVDTVKLQAVKDDDGVCVGLFSGNKDVELSQMNAAPTGVTGQSMMINNTPIAKYPAFTPNTTLNFGADSKAVIPSLVYLDAGQINLKAKYNVGGVNLVGSSNDFWVSPYKLAARAHSGGNNIDGDSHTSTTTHKAGQAFNFTVTAYNSLGTGLSNITKNYIPNDIQVLLARTGPTIDGFDGVLNYGSGGLSSAILPIYQSISLTPFSGGVSVANNASYSEVGLLNLDIQDLNYGYSGNIVSGDAINIGRFYPDHFDLTITSNSFGDACTSGTADFTYIGQPFSYFNAPEILITAKNLSGSITRNYTAPDYQKLDAADIDRTFPLEDSTKDGVDNITKMALLALTNDGGLEKDSDGILKFTFSTLDSFTYTKNENSFTIPFTMDYDIVIDAIQDSDGANASVFLASDIPSTNTLSPTGVNLRFGRWNIENTFGPETSNLPLPMTVQYWNGSRFLVNTLDTNCTAFDAVNLIVDDTSLNPGTTNASGNGNFVNGETSNLILSAPGTPNQGAVPVIYNIPSMPWLLYDWTWNGVDPKVFDENPSATATFGQYRGNDRIIYQREVQ